jgi:TetR/AcrR family transcriptional regulator
VVDDKKTTETLIFEAALRVFQKKGLAGARMQEIADEAGINKSMLHYYFRSKELLFRQIFLQSFKQFIGSIIPLMNQDVTWEEKIHLLIEHYASIMQKNPDLPLFIFNELKNNPEEFISIVKENTITETLFIRQIKQGIESGKIRKISPQQILITINSGIIFPFMAQPMVKYMASLHDTDWDSFITDRKRIIEEMLIKYLKEF